jgi:hypothetical protein
MRLYVYLYLYSLLTPGIRRICCLSDSVCKIYYNLCVSLRPARLRQFLTTEFRIKYLMRALVFVIDFSSSRYLIAELTLAIQQLTFDAREGLRLLDLHESVHRDTTLKITNKLHYID